MAQIFRKDSRVVLALMVGAFLSFAASRAVAQDNEATTEDSTEGVRVQLGITGGYHWFAKDLELGVIPSTNHPPRFDELELVYFQARRDDRSEPVGTLRHALDERQLVRLPAARPA